MDKLEMKTPNIANENYKKLVSLFPNAITETIDENGEVVRAIDKDILIQEINCRVVDGLEERYQFTWPDKKKSLLLANSPTIGSLRPSKEESVNFDATENLYIEGDNLEILKLLRETYLNKIDIIYIDPPYNSGNDFVYDDNYSVNVNDFLSSSNQFDDYGNRLLVNLDTNGRFHTDWLNMIYPRLKLSKDLLADGGVIFISIDDNELENLKKVCNEIFGDHNFCGQYMWYKSATPANLSYKIKKNLEYVLCYQKSKDNTKFYGIKKESKSSDPMTKPQNSIKKLSFPPNTFTTKIKDSIIEPGIYGTEKYPNKLLNRLIIKNGTNENLVEFENKFIWKQETLDENIKNKTEFFLSEQLVISYKRNEYAPEVPPNLIDASVGVNTTEEAGKELGSLLGVDKVFEYPKSVSLIKYLLSFVDNDNCYILDFFSGSATTAQAVMELNAKDEGHRKFIMVQLPEATDNNSIAFDAGYNSICDIGKERIRCAAKMIFDDNPNSNFDGGFRVLKLDSSNMKDVYYSSEEYDVSLFDSLADNIKEDRSPEDLLFQIMLDLGVLLSSKIEEKTIDGKTVFNVADNFLVACFDNDVTEDLITEVAKGKPYYFVMRDSSLASDSVAANFDQIFATYSPNTVRKVL